MGTPKHLKIVFRGTFGTSKEEWSFGTHWSCTRVSSPDAGVDDIDGGKVDDAVAALMGIQGNLHFPADTKATEWRAYVIGPLGTMVGNPRRRIFPTPIPGMGATTYPPQVALVVSTIANNRGPGRKGRFYLPAPSNEIDSDMRLSATTTGAAKDAVTTFVKAVSDAIDIPLDVTSSTMLNISGAPAPSGSSQVVDHIEVGRVLDTLRSRRKSLLEEYVVGGHIDW